MGFKNIIIGTIFLFLYYYNGIDILPDFLGYIFIFMGLGVIVNYTPKFKIARIFASLLIFISLVDFLNLLQFFIEFNIPYIYIFNAFLQNLFIPTILFLLYSYFLYIGISENANKFGFNSLRNKARKAWYLILIYEILMYFPVYGYIFQILIFIFSIIVGTMQLIVLLDAKRYLEE